MPGIRVGHSHNQSALTGCTVILPSNEAVAGIDVRGSAPGTRETEALKPVRLIEKIHAVLLTGGSSFGLDAAGGVQQYLERNDIGFDVGVAKVPIVPAAVIFDLAVGDPRVRPNKEMGYKACLAASDEKIEQGRVGVGCGATVGKLLGIKKSSNGGIGSASEKLSNNIIIGVLAVVNSLGEVINSNGKIVAGIKGKEIGSFIPSLQAMKNARTSTSFMSTNTTLAVVATNALLSKEQATKVAQMAQDGIARSIRPAHTMYDGDIIFVLSVGEEKAEINLLGTIACDLISKSIVRAVLCSNH